MECKFAQALRQIEEDYDMEDGELDRYHPAHTEIGQLNINPEDLKVDYHLPENCNMYDMCFCRQINGPEECKTPCGRRQEPKEKRFTCSNFADICKSYRA